MAGCSKPRQDQVDGRKRFCPAHAGLSYFTRWRLQRRGRAALAYEVKDRLGSAKYVIGGQELPPRSDGLGAEFSAWLRLELARANMDYRTLANRAGLSSKTVYNWTSGISYPRTAEDLQLLCGILDQNMTPVEFLLRFIRQDKNNPGHSSPPASSAAPG